MADRNQSFPPPSYEVGPVNLDLLEYLSNGWFGPAIPVSAAKAAKLRAKDHERYLMEGRRHYYNGEFYG